MKRSTVILFLMLLVGMQASAYKKQSININVNNKQRNMVVFTPTTLPAKSPLLIVTHGMNQDPEYQYGSDKLYEMIDTAKFVVAYLRSDGSTWDTGGTNDQNFVLKTIDEMSTYELTRKGSFEAMAGHHDDILMTRAIALQVLHELPMPHPAISELEKLTILKNY